MSPLWRAHPQEIDFAELDPERARDRRTRFLQIMVVVTTLAIAIVGFAESYVAKGVDEAAVRAQEQGVNTMAELRGAQERAHVALETFALAQELRVRESTVQQQLIVVNRDATKQALQLARERWKAMAETTERLATIKRGTPDSPERDTSFPFRLLTNTWPPRHRAFALKEIALEDFLMWKRQANYYVAVLTMFSVALYMFGLALATRAHARQLFMRVAVGLLGLGGFAAIVASIPLAEFLMHQSGDRGVNNCPAHPAGMRPPDRYADVEQLNAAGTEDKVEGAEGPSAKRAADCYAAGMTASDLATDPQGYRRAIAFFDRAVAARPQFAAAYLARGDAYYSSGSIPAGGYNSIVDPSALQKSVDDYLVAQKYLKDSTEVAEDLGNGYLQLALIGRDSQGSGQAWGFALLHNETRVRSWRLARSIEFTKRAIDGDAAEPTLQYNLAVALFAANGPTDETKRSFDSAAKKILALHKARPSGVFDDSTIWEAFTDLSKIAGAHLRPAPEVQEIKEYILHSLSGREPGASRPVRTLTVDVLPAGLRWTGPLGPSSWQDDPPLAVWYFGPQDSSRNPETVLTDASGISIPGLKDGQYSDLAPYLAWTSTPSCVRAGRYLVEVYVNGQLAGRGEAGSSFPRELQAAVAPDQNMLLCRPADWTRYKSVIGFVEGYVAPDGKHGAFIYRYQHPRVPGEDRNATSRSYIQHALGDLREFFPSAPSSAQPCWDESNGRAMSSHGVWHRYDWYRYEGGCVFAKSNIYQNGTVLIDLVFGPREYFNGREPVDILESMLSLHEEH
jgi:tetratricopeptide (TPR) repeat protein